MKNCIVILSLLFLLSCAAQKLSTEPVYLQKTELELLTLVSTAKELTLNGRFEQAELYFLRALEINKHSASLYKDLGFALSGQQRHSEALKYYAKAFELDSKNIDIMKNYSRSLFENNQYEESRKILYLVENFIFEHSYIFPFSELAFVYRSLSHIDYRTGYLDEAVCNSQSF